MNAKTSSKTLVLAQFGCGYWGPNVLRNFTAVPDCTVKYVVDLSAERRDFVKANFPRSIALDSFGDVLNDDTVDAVIIATPATTHFDLALQALRAGKHVFVEKPLATKVSEVDELAARAEERGLIVMAGHTFVYNSAVRYVKKLIEAGELGDVRYIYSQRLNLGRIRTGRVQDIAGAGNGSDRHVRGGVQDRGLHRRRADIQSEDIHGGQYRSAA